MRKPARLTLETLAPFLLDVPVNAEGEPLPVTWTAAFGNDRPVEIEVGCGKGQFLLDSATSRPDTNFVGIEVVRGLQLYVATRLAKRTLPNAKVAWGDARRFFLFAVPPASVRSVHVYFPDPWWKARHKKRRVFTAEFAADVARSLEPGGQLLIGTDVEEYFGVMTTLVSDRREFQEVGRRVESGEPSPGATVTNFERKARLRGGSVWRAEYRKA